MISLDQVLLLEQKVESAVKKITQLQAENDALRNKCAELTNALSSKSEQLTSFEQDQSRIENGILKALDRLNSIENSVLKAAGQDYVQSQTTTENQPAENQIVQQQQEAQVIQHTQEPQLQEQTTQQPQQDYEQPQVQQEIPEQQDFSQSAQSEYSDQEQSIDDGQQSFFDMPEVQNQEQQDSGQFDIF